jgi:hypothetical protein
MLPNGNMIVVGDLAGMPTARFDLESRIPHR